LNILQSVDLRQRVVDFVRGCGLSSV